MELVGPVQRRKCVYRRECDGRGARSIGIFIFVLACFLYGSQSAAFAAAGVSEEPASLAQTMWANVATYGAPLLAYVVFRTLTVHLVLHYMMRRAPGLAGAEGSAAEKQDAAASSKEDLHFFELNSAKGILLNDPYQDRLERALATGRRTWGIFWKSFLVFPVAFTILYAFFTAVTEHTDAGAESAAATEVDTAGAAQIGIHVLLGFLVVPALIILIINVGNRYRSTGRVPLLSSISGLLLLAALAFGVGKALALPFYLYLLPPVCSALVVVRGYAKIRRAASAEGNIKLLILRVFGSDRNTSFVFGPLMRSWQFLGVFFTIVDPSYIRYQFSLSSSENRWKLLRFFTLFGLFIAAFSWGQYFLLQFLPSTNPALAAWQELNSGQQRELLGMVAWLVLIPLAVFPVLTIVKTRFIQSLPDLDRRIDDAQRQDGGWGGIFEGFPMYCYDNVWKKAVHALLQVSDVVLMDLRGFSPARLGCEYEVGVLIDQYPIHRIIFLVDQAETKEAVYQLIRRRWGDLKAASPNRSLKSPTIKVYAPDDQEARDIPRILALLVASVEKDGESAGSMISFEGAQPLQEAGVVRARSTAGRRHLAGRIAERVDMAVSSPTYFRIIMPIMLVFVLGLLYLRLRPVVSSFKTYSSPKVVTLTDSPQDATGQPASGRPATPAYLKTEADASVVAGGGILNDRSYSNPIEARIDFTGGVASEARRYGQVRITSAVSDTGDPLEILSVGPRSFGDLQASFVTIDRAAKDFSTEQPVHPRDGFRLKIRFFKPEKEFVRVRSIAGTMTLQTIDPARTVRIENIGSNLSGPGVVRLRHPKLDALGEFSLMIQESDTETARLIVKGQRLQYVDARIIDAHGNPAPSKGDSTATVGEDITKTFAFSAENNSLTNARLEIILGYQSTEAPFDVRNIVIQK